METPKNRSRKEYMLRTNRVQDYVKSNLDSDLSLDVLANVGCFSKFYFNRIFQSIVGESPSAFVSRNRVEASAFKLLNNPDTPITSIAYDCGFSSPSVYSRAFKERYLLSPSQWRSQKTHQKSNICKVMGNNRKALSSPHLYIDSLTNKPKWRIEMNDNKPIEVDVRQMAEIPIAYIRHRGNYDPQDKELFQRLFKKLMKWAVPLSLFTPPKTKAMTIYSSGHPDTTKPENLCVDVCISLSENIAANGDVGVRTIPKGEYAVVSLIDSTLEECNHAWAHLFEVWLPESGYLPGDGAYYMNHLNDPEQHPEKLHNVEMYLPVKPLT